MMRMTCGAVVAYPQVCAEAMSSIELLPLIRDLYSRNPDYRQAKLAAWELQTLLWSLGSTDELEDEGEIAAAVAKLVVQTYWIGRAA